MKVELYQKVLRTKCPNLTEEALTSALEHIKKTYYEEYAKATKEGNDHDHATEHADQKAYHFLHSFLEKVSI